MRSIILKTILTMAVLIISFSNAAEIKRQDGTVSGDFIWYSGTLFKIDGKGWDDTKSYYDRLPAKAEGSVTKDVWWLSHNSAGMAIHFVTDADSMKVRWILTSSSLALPHMPATGVSGIDLYIEADDGKLLYQGNGRPKTDTNIVQFKLKRNRKYVLYFPLYNGLKSIEIGIPKDKYLNTVEISEEKKKKTIVFYGTSITQGACASRPGMAFTNIVGRKLNVPVINLGFSGNGKMEMVMADLLAELNPAVYVLDCLWNMSPELISERFEPFIRQLRAKKPNIPIVLAEDSNYKNISPTPKGEIAYAIYEKLIKEGMKDLYYLPNKGMLGSDYDGTVDGCHPNDLGNMRMADVFAAYLKRFVEY
jgi:lysophospholipase L1-like esterase